MTTFGPDDLAYLEADTFLVQPFNINLEEYVFLLEEDGVPIGTALRSRLDADAWVSEGAKRSYRQIVVRDLAE